MKLNSQISNVTKCQVNEKQNSVQEEEEEEEGQEEEEPEDVFRSIQQSVDDDDAARLSTLLIRTGLIGDKDADDNAALYLRLLKTLSQAKQRHIRTTNSVRIFSRSFTTGFQMNEFIFN